VVATPCSGGSSWEARGTTGVQAEVAAGGKATVVLRHGVVGGGVMDGRIGRGSGEMRMVAAAWTTESSRMVRGVGSGRQRWRRCGAAPLVVGSGGRREVSIWIDVELQSFYSSG
jgi:hypothetical protein